jgi:hypothetical protein
MLRPNLHGGHIALIALLHEARDFLLQKPWEIRQGFMGQWSNVDGFEHGQFIVDLPINNDDFP